MSIQYNIEFNNHNMLLYIANNNYVFHPKII